jgi:hypothetical protein
VQQLENEQKQKSKKAKNTETKQQPCAVDPVIDPSSFVISPVIEAGVPRYDNLLAKYIYTFTVTLPKGD